MKIGFIIWLLLFMLFQTEANCQSFHRAKLNQILPIAYNSVLHSAAQFPSFQKSIILNTHKTLSSAHLTITALGLYEPYLNGKKISKDYFAPGWRNYTQTLNSQTYNLTKQIKKQNTLSILLNPGWYSGPFGADKTPNHYGNQPAFCCSLTLKYTDGSTQTISSGKDWTATTSYIKQSDFYDGELQDTRPKRLTKIGIQEMQAPNIKITPSVAPPIQTHETFGIKKHWEDQNNNTILDFGQNLAGFVRLAIKGRAGDTLFVRHAETLDENGNFYTGNLRLAKATDTYILNGKQQTLAPHFTYHGFRYASIRISPAKPDNNNQSKNNKTETPNQNLTNSATSPNTLKGTLSQYTPAHKNNFKTNNPNPQNTTQHQHTLVNKNFNLKKSPKKTSPPKPSLLLLNPQTTLSLGQTQSVALYSSLNPAGTFTSSNPLINKLQSNILWSMKSNFISVPTDCPQRSERYGWTGDAQVFFNTAAYNKDVNTFYKQYLQNILTDQGSNGGMPNIIPDFKSPNKGPKGGTAGWGDAAVLIPWRHYQFYGQKDILKAQYNSMKAWVDYIRSRTQNGLWLDKGYGDWYAQGDSTSLPYINQAYYAHSCAVVAKAAGVLGKKTDAETYTKLAEEIKHKFNTEYGDFSTKATRTQTAYLLALEFELLPLDKRQAAADALATSICANGGRLATGFLGTPFLLPVLSRYGYGKLAYDLLLSQQMPSWLYPITKGATTIWEKWDAIGEDGKPKECSLNHFAYGAVGEWFYTGMAGIKATSPGFKTVEISPVIDERMKWVDVRFKSPQGEIRVKWKVVGKRVVADFQIPKDIISVFVFPKQTTQVTRKVPLKTGCSQFLFYI
ncbi:alpha-L-rhamnosidase [Pedobacter aquatilis]|uniref:alpha-L-rhamnosidase n=1 Tax=Pedobacter aquatilis TaxID=351343 RepID=UPI002930CCC6|nr:family 78 glycoside hydrolase catalytic domain [Pedobacter aquatilis]